MHRPSPLPKPPADEAERQARMDAYAAEWRAVATNTEPADRPRAEALIGELYRQARRPVPRFEWVGSPMAGTLLIDRLAAGGEAGELVAERRWRRNRSPDPLAMDADWLARRAKHLRRSGREVALQIDLTGPSRRIQSVIGAAIELSARNRFDSWLVRWPAQFDPDRAKAMDALGRQLYGEQWDFTARWIGHDRLARDFERRFRDFVAGSIVGRSQQIAAGWERASRTGQFDAVHAQIAATRVVHGIRMRRQEVDELERWLDLARSTGPWWSYEDVVVVCERPLAIRLDDAGRPHAEDGPAIAYPDGFEVWAWHGVTVPDWVVREPGRIDLAGIDAEVNAEVRRVMIERFGRERFVREGGAQLVDEDETGRLWRHRVSAPARPNPEEPIVMVEVLNATPEPDGTRKTYFLRVPPRMQTPREAVAWTFGLGAAEYRPEAET